MKTTSKNTFIFRTSTFDFTYEILSRTENRIEAYDAEYNEFATFEKIDGEWYAVYPNKPLIKSSHLVHLVGV